MLSQLQAMFRYFNQAVPFRLVPALVTTAVLFTLLALPHPDGLNPIPGAWSPSSSPPSSPSS